MWQVGSVDIFGAIKVIEPSRPDTIYLSCNECHPISITEEWLRKVSIDVCKYQQEGNGYDYKPGYLTYEGNDYLISENVFIRYSVFRYKDSSGHFIEEDEGFRYFKGTPGAHDLIRAVDSIHQLQNLHHALTGEELQIK